MKRFQRELLDVNRAAVGTISGVFGLYMLARGGIDLTDALTPLALHAEVAFEDMLTPEVMQAGLELSIALGATAFGQIQLAHSVYDA